MAGRPPLPIGAYGSITTTELAPGRVRAQTWVRDYDGRRRRVERTGRTKTAATNALKTALANRDQTPGAYDQITPASTVEALAEAWLTGLEERVRDGKLRPQSLATYRSTVRQHVVPALGGYRLRELSTGRVERFYRSLTHGSATEAAKVLRMMLDIAIRHDAVTVNTAKQAKVPDGDDTEIAVLSVEELLDLRARVQLWLDGKIDDEGQPRKQGRGGPAPRPDLIEIIDMLLATGLRPGELLATRWPDIDQQAKPMRLHVTGTLVFVTGSGIVRQDKPKTRAGERSVALPPFGEEIIRRRYKARWAGVRDDVVFPSSSLGYLDPNNLRRVWRSARHAAGYDWVELRTMRRTVATVISDHDGIEAAAEQLGHEGTRITRKHYVARRPSTAPDLTATLQAFLRDRPA